MTRYFVKLDTIIELGKGLFFFGVLLALWRISRLELCLE